MAKKFNVTGMTCAACQAHVQNAVSKVKGVTSCSVNLLTNSMLVEGSASDESIIKAVTKAGYGASLSDGNKVKEKDSETLRLLGRFILSFIILLGIMYFSMGVTMWGWRIPKFFRDDPSAIATLEMVLSIIVMGINHKFFISGFKSLFRLHPNMDSLVALGSSAAFIYSFVTMILCGLAIRDGNAELSMHYAHGLYFETAAMIPTLITIGKTLESASKGRTTNALKELMNLAPKTATVLKDGVETDVLLEDVKVGDLFILRAGSSVPVDGTIVEGNGSFDESALTGESIPNDKEVGSDVFSGTILNSGYVVCEAKKVGEDTTLSKIIKMVEDANTGKAPIAKIADKVSYVFVPVIILIAIIVLTAWLIYGGVKGSPDLNTSWVAFALARGISVLVIACPCSLGLATPVAIMVGSGKGAKNGILFKTAEALEETGKCEIVVFDKTGTITMGVPTVNVFKRYVENDELLKIAHSLEEHSEHPLAKAIMNYGEVAECFEVNNYETLAGNGVSASILGKEYFIGKLSYIESKVRVPKDIKDEATSLSKEGNTCIFLDSEGKLLAMFAIADVVREDAKEAIAQLHRQGVRTIMLTGDNLGTAKAIANKVGIDEVVAEVLPNEKEAVIRSLQKEGKVIMVGDGINDAPALTRADIGIGISSGTDVAIESAQVVITRHTLTSVPAAIRLSRRTFLNIKENLFWAFFYNAVCIPVAAGAFYFILGWAMNPMIGAGAMALSSVCVVLNALRLNLVKVYNGKHDHPLHKSNKGENKMEKTLKVEGMMCAHCEAHVKEALEKVRGVESATADHVNKKVVITLSKEVKEEKLVKAIEEAGYRVIGE